MPRASIRWLQLMHGFSLMCGVSVSLTGMVLHHWQGWLALEAEHTDPLELDPACSVSDYSLSKI